LKYSTGFVLLAWAVALTGLSPVVNAFTMGELRGSAVIGRTLDVSVQVQAGHAEDLVAACFSAEVFHAETRQSTPLVSVLPAAADAAWVRVQSAALVDEPVVSLELRSHCGSSTTRRYVLLADVEPPQKQLPTAQPVANPAPMAAAATVMIAPTAMATGSQSAASAVEKRRALAPAAPKKSLAGKSGSQPGKPDSTSDAPNRARAAAPSGRSASKSVLKLDPLDLFSDRIAALDGSLLFEPTADALQQSRQVAELQQDVKLLRTLAAKNDAQLLELKAQLQLAQSLQISPTWFYTLGGAALVGLMALAWLIWLQRHTRSESGQTWHDSLQWPATATAASVATPHPSQPDAPAPSPTLPLPQEPLWAAAPVPSASPPAQAAQPDHGHAPDEAAARGSLASGLVGLHSFSVEPILDIRQQAEFFMSLGQTDRALHILKQQIASSAEPNPFIYLDLLALLHSLGMKAEFREYRHQFNQHFSGSMPDFPAFHLEGRDLLDYPDVLARLVQGWPSAKTLVLLNGWIFRNPKASTHVSFDLAAFRDLLLLHALAEEVATDLPWDAPAPPVASGTLAEPDEASIETAPGRLPARTAPAELNVQTLDMDFSMFDSGMFGLDAESTAAPATEATQLPSADLPRARWPTKNPS